MNTISSRFKPIVDDGAETLIDITDTKYPQGQSPQDAMHHPYYLRGVATNLGVVYLLHPNTQSNVEGAQQWWRMQYDTESTSPTIRRDRLTQEEVVERASSEHASVLLVYAHKDAISLDPVPLSKALDEFVKKDGVNFMEELQQNPAAWDGMGYDSNNDVPRGDWENHPPDYEDDWASMSAHNFHTHHRNDSNMSSATLTPNTDHDIVNGVREMIEINGGMDALTGLSSPASNLSLGITAVGDTMDVDATKAWESDPASSKDMAMTDVKDEPTVQHIETAERKGG